MHCFSDWPLMTSGVNMMMSGMSHSPIPIPTVLPSSGPTRLPSLVPSLIAMRNNIPTPTGSPSVKPLPVISSRPTLAPHKPSNKVPSSTPRGMGFPSLSPSTGPTTMPNNTSSQLPSLSASTLLRSQSPHQSPSTVSTIHRKPEFQSLAGYKLAPKTCTGKTIERPLLNADT